MTAHDPAPPDGDRATPTNQTDGGDPATDPRAGYDYRVGGVERRDLAATLDRRTDGEVRFDDYSRSLYATDASIYEVTPVGVAFPASTADVSRIVETCGDRGVAVLPRGAGTSLAGQAVNEAVVLDFTRHLDDVRSVDPEARTATAGPGVVLGELNDALSEYGLKFAPDPAWGDKSTLGGAIGNNSTGAHSLKYGKTDAYLESCEAVLADGTVERLGEEPIDRVRERADPDGNLLERVSAVVARIVDEGADAVREAFPDLKRNVSGYDLDVLVEAAHAEREDGQAAGTVNLARLLAGSEGTLAVVTEATVSLEPVPGTKAVALLTYDDLLAAMEDVEPILDHDPAAVEVLDDVLLDLAGDTTEFADVVGMLPSGTGAVLLVEFYADDDREGRAKVAALLADRCPVADPEFGGDPGDVGGVDPAVTDAPLRAEAAMEAHDSAERERFWKLRKSGLPILLSRTTDEKHVSFIEDTAVPPGVLPEFVREFRKILAEHDTHASFYAHAGPGVLHVRPLVNTKTGEGVERMESIAEAVTDLVVEYGGSVSGEHGDGRARTQFNRKLYGDEVFELFRALKTAFDPDWLLNPGQVCGEVRTTENLRFDPEYGFDAGFDPALEYDENGMQGMVELCHGCGGCRGEQETTGGVMCPTYRAANEEGLSTRGRANALRRAMSGDLPEDPLDEEFLAEVMDLCIGCKGCLRDCPSGVDMAKLKAELTHAHHQREGTGRRERLFANIHRLAAVGSRLAPASNWLASLPGADALAERLGIARERDLPAFRHQTLADWMDGRGSVSRGAATRKVLLFPDTFTNYSEPAVGRAAVRALEAGGAHVEVARSTTGSGRPPYSKGFLDMARERARHNVDALAPQVRAGWDVVVAEPSDAVMIQHDYRHLLDGDDVETVADGTYGVLEYVDRFDLLDGVDADPEASLVYHGHCHQTAIKREDHAPSALRAVGYEVDALDSGCCGMAGSFGYEREHYSMSAAIGAILADQLRASPGERVVAPGTSCRTQVADLTGYDPVHPVEAVAEAVRAADRA